MITRRAIIKTGAQFAALLGLPGFVASRELIQSLDYQIAAGLVANQTFYITEPLIIVAPVLIRSCTFIAVNDLPFFVYAAHGAGATIVDCWFLSSGNQVGTVILIDHARAE